MTSLKKLLAVLSIGCVLAANQSCKKDDELVMPTLTVTASKTVVPSNEMITIAISFTAGTDRKVKNLSAEINTNTGTGFQAWSIFNGKTASDSSFDASSGLRTVYYKMPANNVELRFTIKDDKDQKVTKTVVLTTTASTATKTISATLVGAQDNKTNGSFYSTTEVKVYKLSEAFNNPGKIDFCYYVGSTNKVSIAAPADASVQGGTSGIQYDGNGNGKTGVDAWTIKNNTKFKKATNNTVNITTATNADLETWYMAETNGEGTLAANLSVGNILYFRTEAGKFGAIKITDITNTTGSGSVENGSVTIAGAVQF